MIKAVLIDDEKNSLELLEWQLQTYCPEVEIFAICNNADKGIEAIVEHRPQLVFLDIEMPKKNGFDLLLSFPEIFFDVIFTTAYSQFAVKAFRFAALDFLLKPVDADDLIQAVQRYAKRQLQYNLKEQLSILLQQYRKPESLPQKISFTTQQAIHFVDPSDIVYCESYSNYTTIYFADKSKLVVSKTLKEVEELLCYYHFFRIHHSYLINMKQVARYIKADGGSVEMASGVQLAVSRQRKDELMQLLAYY